MPPLRGSSKTSSNNTKGSHSIHSELERESAHIIKNYIDYSHEISDDHLREARKRLEELKEITSNNSTEDKTHRSYNIVSELIDFALEPDDSEEVIGDLKQQYEKRLVKGRGYAARWIWGQALWVCVNRAFELIRRYARAKTGK